MRIAIRHQTIYRYAVPVRHSIQILRLTPRAERLQKCETWHIQAPARLTPTVDAYGNPSHLLVVSQPHSEIRVAVSGVVEVNPPPEPGWVTEPSSERLSPLLFLVPTPLTEVTPLVAEFASTALRSGADSPGDFLALAEAIEGRVVYRPGITEVSSPARQALELGHGVCQDHAHLFIACCRARGVPARYVSGYVEPGDVEHVATHAWAEVWVAGRGWLSVDVTHRKLVGDRHCRLAIGRDYDSASPIRGLRIGGGEEEMHVDVHVAGAQ